ncbi:MAG: DUF4032 domain-containing protein [Verrucomicrobia bacterium]|nr:MAG: DUF4032 domain-containing protein [Verrucomicrobiota bacterium]
MSFQSSFESASCPEGDGLLTGSSLYREFLAEREEVLRHKWFESEKAGHDIGIEHARISWVVHHRAQWRKERQRQCPHAAMAR